MLKKYSNELTNLNFIYFPLNDSKKNELNEQNNN
jgi:hypothetical protein